MSGLGTAYAGGAAQAENASQGHQLRGNYDASVDIVSASLTFRWGGARERVAGASKQIAGDRK